MTTDPSTMTPVEIDRVLSENYNEQMKLVARIQYTVRDLERIKKSKYGTPAEVDKFTARLLETREALEALIAASAPYQVEYNRRPWNRYFLVTNGNGHVHRGMNCTTCFPTTQYGWLVDLADCDEDAMIEEWGERACTVCFPTAPTNPLYNRPARVDREEQERRAAEKAAKQAAKDEKAITDVDGSSLKVGGEVLRTKVAARNKLSERFQYLVFYGDSHPDRFEDHIRTLVPALNAAGIDWVPVAERAIKKAGKEAAVPAHNPFHLTQDQIDKHESEIIHNTGIARRVLEEMK